MPTLSENAGDPEGRDRAPRRASLLIIIAGLLGLCMVAAVLIASVLDHGDKPKERNRCTEKAGLRAIYLAKEKHPPDKYNIICDPTTGIVYTTEKLLGGGIDGGEVDGGKGGTNATPDGE